MKAHPEELISMTSPWLFTVWEIDLISRLPKGRGNLQYVVVAVNYFTKWVEVEALASIIPVKIRISSTRISFADMEFPTPLFQTTTLNSTARSSVTTYKSGLCSPQLHDLKIMGRSRQ